MDYRNADGSIAEMCGNGVRVFVRHLIDEGLVVGPSVPVGTRAGLRTTEVLPDGRIRVAMGPARVSTDDVRVLTADGREFAAVPVDVGNPHAVSFCADPAAIDLRAAPTWQPGDAFPSRGERRVRRRARSRATWRCGSTSAAPERPAPAAPARWPRPRPGTHRHGPHEAGRRRCGRDVRYRVDVPGGTVEVELGEQTFLTGPAVVVARGELRGSLVSRPSRSGRLTRRRLLTSGKRLADCWWYVRFLFHDEFA